MSSSLPEGFVVAMRAKLSYTSSLPAIFEWVIVSRWGPHGTHLALGWTSTPAFPGDAPIGLLAVRTSLASLVVPGNTTTPATFRFASAPPAETTIIGAFVPARGIIRLSGRQPDLRLEARVQFLPPNDYPACRVRAAREPWFGEFIETTR